jgi:superfamily II DNA or RNA helicase
LLTDLDLQQNYRSGQDALLDDFYIPCLQESVLYDRAVGYFSSSLLHVLAIAYSDFVQRRGHMRLVCSPAISPADFEAMQTGYEYSRHAQHLVREEMELLLENPRSLPATRLLASLIAIGTIDIQIASPRDTSGIFHDKLGIFEDEAGRRVSYVGSANETWAAWGLNHESFEVFSSWRGESDLLRTRRHASEFDRLWNRNEPSLVVEGLDRVTRDRLLEVADDDIDHAIQMVRSTTTPISSVRVLMPHQLAVLESWRREGHRGVIAFATGAGKTLTALAAVKEWTSTGLPALILVPSRELHRQWLTEIALEIPQATPLLCGGGTAPESWRDLLAVYTSPSTTGASARIVLSTNATFCSPEFQLRLRDGNHLLVVADEMHRLGSKRNRSTLQQIQPGASLGLSATYRRQFDEVGTAGLLNWFGPVLEPVIGLAEAIILGLLVSYDYRLHTVTLDSAELGAYKELTERIKLITAIAGQSEGPLPENLKMLLITRARIMKKAAAKIGAAIEVLSREYRDKERWLVYCDDRSQLKAVVEAALERDLPVMEYYAEMAGNREAVLESLAHNGGIVVAIRCLDEGVDIPTCDSALILASSTAAREYIQRRGRVLRSSPGKTHAVVHDLLLVDEHDGILARSEATRALEFARLSRNPAARARLKYHLALSSDVILPAEMVDEEEGGDEDENEEDVAS